MHDPSGAGGGEHSGGDPPAEDGEGEGGEQVWSEASIGGASGCSLVCGGLLVRLELGCVCRFDGVDVGFGD